MGVLPPENRKPLPRSNNAVTVRAIKRAPVHECPFDKALFQSNQAPLIAEKEKRIRLEGSCYNISRILLFTELSGGIGCVLGITSFRHGGMRKLCRLFRLLLVVLLAPTAQMRAAGRYKACLGLPMTGGHCSSRPSPLSASAGCFCLPEIFFP